MKIDQYKQAWEEFKNKMAELRKRQTQILARISEKLDKQKTDQILNKLKK